MSGKHKNRKSSGLRGKTPTQAAALIELRTSLYREFANGKDRKDLKELSATYHRSQTQIRDYHKLYVAGEFEAYRPADVTAPVCILKEEPVIAAPKEEVKFPEVAPTVRWVSSGFIPALTKAQLMRGR